MTGDDIHYHPESSINTAITPMIIEEPSILESSKDSSVKNNTSESLEDMIARTIEKQVEKSLSKLMS